MNCELKQGHWMSFNEIFYICSNIFFKIGIDFRTKYAIINLKLNVMVF